MQAAVHIERTFNAPPNEIFQAWLEPKLLAQWLAPGNYRVSSVQMDARVGGQFQIIHRNPNTEIGGFTGVIEELVPDERLVFRWGFLIHQTQGRSSTYDSRLSVLLRALPDKKTLLTLRHERLEELATAVPEVSQHVEAGWSDVLKKLAALKGNEIRKPV